MKSWIAHKPFNLDELWISFIYADSEKRDLVCRVTAYTEEECLKRVERIMSTNGIECDRCGEYFDGKSTYCKSCSDTLRGVAESVDRIRGT